MPDLKDGEHQNITIGKYEIYRNDYDGQFCMIVKDGSEGDGQGMTIHEDKLEELIDSIFEDEDA